ncbi:murein biosynthesis integral membrane protein MurJ [Desnuesiella massiliensis]|uniref:murein biosynthesis integral membrane protein MurJ n=1 Tax=Desnuesiella massiliensis TaxID=1650662 RepID=UPI0006E43AD4|nr:murein biosynthesis integral membrane protein MurJ [Desnuesiella massiliensis]
MSQKKIVKSISILMVISLFSRVLGFLRDILVASAFGANYQTDAYNVAVALPEIVFGIIGLAISTTFIPILSEIYTKEGKKEMFLFSNNINNILSIISLFVFIIGMVFTSSLIKIIAPNFNKETLELTVLLTRISLINILFMTLNACYTAFLQVMDDFIVPSLLGIFFNLPIIAYIFIFKNYDIIGLTIATTIGNLLRVLVQIPSLLKHNYKFHPFYFRIKDRRIIKILYLIIPVVIGAGVNQINLIIDKAIASGFEQGSISALNYSSRIILFLNSAISTSIVTVMYPFLSKKYSEKDFTTFNTYLIKSIIYLIMLMAPFTILLMVFSKPITIILFKRGEFNDIAVMMTASTMLFYSIALPFYAVRDLLNAALFSIQKTKTTTINGIIGVIINVFLSILLSKVMGLSGVALATSIASIFICIGLTYSIYISIYKINLHRMINCLKHVFIAIVFMTAFLLLINNIFVNYTNNFIYLSLVSMFSVMVYLLVFYITKLEEFNELILMIKKKIKK